MIGHGFLREKTAAFRQLATLISSGVELSRALDTIAARVGDPRLRRAFREASKHTSTGGRLSEVLARYPRLFSQLTVTMVEAAEKSGRLDEIFRLIADYHEAELHLRTTISRETFYPKVLMAAVLFIPVGAQALIRWIMGNVRDAIAYLVLAVLKIAAAVSLPLLAIWLVWRAVRASEAGGQAIDRLKLSVPVIGKLVHRWAMARFARALSTLFAAGVPISEALELAGMAAANSVIQRAALQAAERVKTGESIGDSLQSCGLADRLVLDMIRTGEETGRLDETLVKAAEYYEDEAMTTARQLTVLIVPVSVIIMGIVVGYMALRFYMGYYGGLLSGP